MNTDFMLNTLRAIAPLSSALAQRIHNTLQQDTYQKKDILLAQGDTCRRIWFVNTGFARAYYLNEKGQQTTTWFMSQGDIMISVYSFLKQTPAQEWIEILEPSTLQSVSYQQLQNIYTDFPEFNYTGRILTEHYYLRSEDRAVMLRTRSPEERYQHLLDHHPGIFQQASQKDISSFLCITQETLSRLRARLSHEHPITSKLIR